MLIHEDSIAVDRAVQLHMEQHPGINYEIALSAIVRHANAVHTAKKTKAVQTYSAEHGKPKDLGWRIYEDRDGNIVEAEMVGTGTNINRLADIVLGTPRPIDASEAVLKANKYPDIARHAAGDFLSFATMEALQHVESGDSRGAMFGPVFSETAKKYPPVLAVYHSGVMNETALRTILAPLFQQEEKYQKRAKRPW